MTTSKFLSDRAATRRVLIIILVLNISVCLAKLVAGILANSLAVLSDALHSSIDAINNIVGIVLLRMAAKEPDVDHPYGHAKIETLGAFCIAGFMLITCYEITKQALTRLFGGQAPEFEITFFTFAVMGATLLVNIFVVLYEKAMARRFSHRTSTVKRTPLGQTCSLRIANAARPSPILLRSRRTKNCRK